MLAAPLNIVELYAGTARSVEPFRQWQRCKVSLLVDNNKHAKQTYLFNHPNTPYVVRNLGRLKPGQLATLVGGRVDVLLGCPPCQGFSENGTREPGDTRNRHLHRFGVFAEALKPLAIAMENVPVAATSQQFSRFTQRIDAAGYQWTAGIINAALRGSAQCRHRLVFIAIRKDVKATPVFPDPAYGAAGRYFSYKDRTIRSIDSDRDAMLGVPSSLNAVCNSLPYQEDSLGPGVIPCVRDVLAGLPRLGTPTAVALSHIPWAHQAAQLRRMAKVPEGERWKGGKDHYSQSYGRLHRRGLARTITTAFPNAGSGRFWHPTENRALTLREAARLQGYPDTFAFLPPYSRSAFLVGNALDAAIANVTYEMVRACLS
jgi:DNA (cytosine-5)-methyltransferase 1